jgi:hypothetical protein
MDADDRGQGFAAGKHRRAAERQIVETEASGEADLRPLPAKDRTYPSRAMFGKLC